MRSLTSTEILKALPVKYYVIYLPTKEILNTNDPDFHPGDKTCFLHIFNKELPCENEGRQCICERKFQLGQEVEFSIENGFGEEKKYYSAKATFPEKDVAVVSYENISLQKHSEKELKINQRRLMRAQRLANFGYWEFNLVDKIMLSSEGSQLIYGVENDMTSLEEAQKIPLPKYREKLDEAMKSLILKGKPYNVTFEIKRPNDGKIRRVRSIAEYRKDKNMVFGVIHDITDTYIARKALEESEKNLKLMFRNMNSAFAFHKIITDEKGTPVDYVILDVNSKFEEVTGLKREKIINKRILEVLPETKDYWIKRYGKVALTGKSINFSDYLSELDKYFQVSAYSTRKGFFAVIFLDISDRIKSEEKLNEALIDLNLAQQISKTGNWKYYPSQRKILWSKQLYEIFERDTNLLPPNLAEIKKYSDKLSISQYKKAIKKAITEGIPFELQMKLLTPGYDSKWVKIICQPDKERGVAGHFLRGTVQDITSGKKAEEELNKSHKLLRAIIDIIPDAIYMKDVNFRKLVANMSDVRNCGVNSLDELIGKTDHNVFPKEAADIYIKDDKQVIESGEPVINREEIIPDKKIGQRWLLTTKIPLRNDDGEIIGLVGIARDITELKQKEMQLQLLQQTIEQSPLSVAILSRRGIVEYINPSFTKTTGYSSDEVVGKDPIPLLDSGESYKAYFRQMKGTVVSGKKWSGEFKSKRKDGTIYWENAVFAPILDNDQNIQYIVAISEDISEKKNMIEALQLAKEKAEESDRLKSLFLANMSHEIRTPLNGILGFSNIICSGDAEPDKLEMYGKIIENSGRRLLTVIDDIIDISKIQANQLNIYYDKFSINELINELYVFYRSRTPNADQLKNVELKFQLCQNEDHSWAYSDKNRVYQILRNLIDNAIKFTHSGSIEFGCLQSTDDELTLFVKDTGIGIDPEKQKIIFQSFRQAQEGKSRKYDGSGLGLSIVSGILDRLNGKIWVDSKLGEGTVFYVLLPRNKEKMQTQLAVEKITPVKRVSKNVFKRIISVEDDSASIDYLKIVIKSLGYEHVNFKNATEAINYLKSNQADLVLMDIQLPEMNGYDATRILKSEFPNLPVIIQTAYAMKADMEKAYEAGCNDYLSKPLSLRLLKEKIKLYIERN